MKPWIGVLCLASLVVAGPLLLTELQSQQPPQPTGIYPSATSPGAAASASAGSLISSVVQLPNGKTQLIVIDATSRTIATYFIAAETGGIELKSVRNIDADLRLMDVNGSKPSPDEVRAVVQP